jgi:TatD DNase family protein
MIDFHCHLDLYPNPVAVRDECDRRGLQVLSVTTTPSAWEGTRARALGSPHIRTALGLHPQLAHERGNELTLFDRFLPETQYVGEIGLDGAPEFRRHWKSQLVVFEHALGKCREVGGRFLSIHSRRATRPVLEYLKSFPGSGTPILHWFSGSFSELDRAIDLGCWFSVGPAMIAGEKGRALVARMPADRVLTESDGPFAQIRGASIMPWGVEGAIQALAQIWLIERGEAHEIVQGNLRRLLNEPLPGVA